MASCYSVSPLTLERGSHSLTWFSRSSMGFYASAWFGFESSSSPPFFPHCSVDSPRYNVDVRAHVFAEAHLLSLGGWILKGEIRAFGRGVRCELK